jgi:hypothetical protein
VTNSRVKTESKCCAPMGNGKKYSTDKILQQVKTIVFKMSDKIMVSDS